MNVDETTAPTTAEVLAASKDIPLQAHVQLLRRAFLAGFERRPNYGPKQGDKAWTTWLAEGVRN